MGLFVWHDLMFACDLYPANSEFAENVKAEIKDNILRIASHSSIILWGGDNEL